MGKSNSKIHKYCDPLISKISDKDVIVFLYGKKAICMDRKTLLKKWDSKYHWGDCEYTVHSDTHCKKFYKLKGKYFWEGSKTKVENNPNMKLWTIKPSGKSVMMGGYETKQIYGLCPRKKKCDIYKGKTYKQRKYEEYQEDLFKTYKKYPKENLFEMAEHEYVEGE